MGNALSEEEQNEFLEEGFDLDSPDADKQINFGTAAPNCQPKHTKEAMEDTLKRMNLTQGKIFNQLVLDKLQQEMRLVYYSQGKSRSRIWYAILDYGTNYCNIHNLVEGDCSFILNVFNCSPLFEVFFTVMRNTDIRCVVLCFYNLYN